jgi:putative transposase
MFKKLPKFNERNDIHFITTKTFNNNPYFGDSRCCLILLEELNFYREQLGFKVLAYVIMPDHFHCLIFWDGEGHPVLTISKIMQVVKSHSAKEISYYIQTGRRKPSLSPYSKGVSEGSHLPNSYEWENRGKVHTKPKAQIWQKGFYDFNIYSEKKLIEKLNYIHNNPVNAGLCKNPENYKWSSYSQIIGMDKNPIFKVGFLEI